MCGFVLVISKKAFDHTDFVKKALNTLKNRGPDQYKYQSYLNNRLWLGHTRLSINDFSSAGLQPMNSDNGNSLIFNGEIYNFKNLIFEYDLSNQLISKSDTEVLITLLNKFGVQKTLSIIHGMYAFAFLDITRRKISIVTDLFGEKPIYYFNSGDDFIASSQLDVIASFRKYNKIINHKKVFEYLQFGYVSNEDSIYEGIKRLPPSTLLELDIDDLKIKKINNTNLHLYHTLDNSNKIRINDVRDNLIKSLEGQLSCDATKGLFLSSGTDSSLIASLAVKELGVKLPTFNASFKGLGWDESQGAQLVADQLGLELNKVNIDSSVVEKYIDKQPFIFHEPFADPAQIASFEISKFAKKNNISVLVGGDGADELFCGYLRLKYANYLSLVENLSLRMPLRKISEFIHNTLTNIFRMDNQFLYRIEKLNNILNVDSQDSYTKLSASDPDICKYTKFSIDIKNDHIMFQDKNLINYVDAMDLCRYLPWDILVKLDRSCMFNGVESRSPFLDKNLANYALSFPVEMLMGKVHLKSILSNYISRELIYKPKKSFGIPLHQLINKNILSVLDNLLMKDQEVFPYLKKQNIRGLIKKSEYTSLSAREAILLWKVLILYKWSSVQ